MKKAIALLALGCAGCAASNAAVNPGSLERPARSLMLPPCESPPYPKDEGNPDSRARWLIADGQCDAFNRSKVEGLQAYARAVSSRSSKP